MVPPPKKVTDIWIDVMSNVMEKRKKIVMMIYSEQGLVKEERKREKGVIGMAYIERMPLK